MVKIWKEKEEPKKEYFLRLLEWNGMPALCLVDKSGEAIKSGYIAYINEDGELCVAATLNAEAATALGIQRDSFGRIKITP